MGNQTTGAHLRTPALPTEDAARLATDHCAPFCVDHWFVSELDGVTPDLSAPSVCRAATVSTELPGGAHVDVFLMHCPSDDPSTTVSLTLNYRTAIEDLTPADAEALASAILQQVAASKVGAR